MNATNPHCAPTHQFTRPPASPYCPVNSSLGRIYLSESVRLSPMHLLGYTIISRRSRSRPSHKHVRGLKAALSPSRSWMPFDLRQSCSVRSCFAFSCYGHVDVLSRGIGASERDASFPLTKLMEGWRSTVCT